jgi:hypothetical protein
MVPQLIHEQPEVIQAIFRKDKAALEELLGKEAAFISIKEWINVCRYFLLFCIEYE